MDGARAEARDAQHIEGLIAAITSMGTTRLRDWGTRLGAILVAGGRLLVAGNGGSAAEAQHLTAELAGRSGPDRRPLSAIALHADTSTLTALGNDLGFAEVFARQVQAHGRQGDVLLLLSTSGRSPNLIEAATAARASGIVTWALTGPWPNPLADMSDEHVAVTSRSVANIQESHLVAVHIMCAAVDASLARTTAAPGADPASPRTAGSAANRPSAPSSRTRAAKRQARGLTVIGDVMLDCDLTGTVDRIAPDAPVPVVNLSGHALRPGGAGLAAVLAAADGHHVTLITALGSNPEAGVTMNLLQNAGVHVVDLGSASPTPVKTRIRADEQTLLRLDRAEPAAAPGPLPAAGIAALQNPGAVLVSDYGRGITAADGIRDALASLVGRIPIVWDPHPKGAVPLPGVSVVTPNDREAKHWAGELGPPGLSGDIARGRLLRKKWRVGHIVVTRGELGAVMVTDDNSLPLVVPAPAGYRGDTCGAGDRLAAALVASLSSGTLLSEALRQAVLVAADFVKGKRMDSERRSDEIHGDDPIDLAAHVRSSGGIVVAAGGCFDLLHPGHLSLLRHARQLGDCLIVCLNSDNSVVRLKGAGRPLVSAEDRAYLLSRISDVDAVLIFDEDTPAEALGLIRPHIYVKGNDYTASDMPERAVVEQHGGQVVVVPYVDGRSTTSLIDRILATGPHR